MILTKGKTQSFLRRTALDYRMEKIQIEYYDERQSIPMRASSSRVFFAC